jgi:hypothetical protein
VKARRLLSLLVAVAVSGCATWRVSPAADRRLATKCRGWETSELPPVRTSGVQGKLLWGKELEAVPSSTVALLHPETGEALYAVHPAADGRFRFPAVPAGTYVLKTCGEGWNTLEQPVTIDPAAPLVRLHLLTTLSA